MGQKSTIVSLKAIKQLINETLGMDAQMNALPIRADAGVDPIAAETNPMEPNFSPQNQIELASAVRAKLQEVPDESAQIVYQAVLSAIETILNKNSAVSMAQVESFLKNSFKTLLKEAEADEGEKEVEFDPAVAAGKEEVKRNRQRAAVAAGIMDILKKDNFDDVWAKAYVQTYKTIARKAAADPEIQSKIKNEMIGMTESSIENLDSLISKLSDVLTKFTEDREAAWGNVSIDKLFANVDMKSMPKEDAAMLQNLLSKVKKPNFEDAFANNWDIQGALTNSNELLQGLIKSGITRLGTAGDLSPQEFSAYLKKTRLQPGFKALQSNVKDIFEFTVADVKKLGESLSSIAELDKAIAILKKKEKLYSRSEDYLKAVDSLEEIRKVYAELGEEFPQFEAEIKRIGKTASNMIEDVMENATNLSQRIREFDTNGFIFRYAHPILDADINQTIQVFGVDVKKELAKNYMNIASTNLKGDVKNKIKTIRDQLAGGPKSRGKLVVATFMGGKNITGGEKLDAVADYLMQQNETGEETPLATLVVMFAQIFAKNFMMKKITDVALRDKEITNPNSDVHVNVDLLRKLDDEDDFEDDED